MDGYIKQGQVLLPDNTHRWWWRWLRGKIKITF
jgi:hypothetical protein